GGNDEDLMGSPAETEPSGAAPSDVVPA
ncbi:MAG: hypothetical protein FD129_2118, partial [bacterium]